MKKKDDNMNYRMDNDIGLKNINKLEKYLMK